MVAIKAMQYPKLTEEHRFEICLHEAAHAVIYSLSAGNNVYYLEVPPEGASIDWEPDQDGFGADNIGICRVNSGMEQLLTCMKWDEENLVYDTDTEPFTRSLDMFLTCKGKSTFDEKKWKREYKRRLRGYIAGTLAGYIAEAIFDDREEDINQWDLLEIGEGNQFDDTTIGEALSKFLPGKNIFEYLVDETKRTLKQPDIWDKVLKLAKALEERWIIEEDELKGYLPEPLSDWPKSPRRAAMAA